MPNEPTIPRFAAGTIINKENFNEVARAVLGGATLTVTSSNGGALIGYTPQFFPKPWVDFVDPVQAGGDNGFNKRFQDIVGEFNQIAAAISSVDDAVTNLQNTGGSVIGLTIVLTISNRAKIPVPTGFQQSETIFFAFPRGFNVNMLTAGTNDIIGFDVKAFDDGTVSAGVTAIPGQTLAVTGIALAKKGGW
jgi:hypothetical protein